jgi:acyl carrier protein
MFRSPDARPPCASIRRDARRQARPPGPPFFRGPSFAGSLALMPESRAHATPGEETREEVRAFVRRRFPLAVTAGVTDEDSLLDSGIIDSLGILDLVAFLEKTYGIRIGDEELNPTNFDSIESVVRFVASKKA